MKVYNETSLPENNDTCCTNTQVKELTTQETGDRYLNIKLFEMNPNGHSPLHTHPEQHRLFITEGTGAIYDGEKTIPIQAGNIVYIMPNEPHQLKTVGKKPLKFIAITISPE